MHEAVFQEVESIMAKFWWGIKEGEIKIHWMRWERLVKFKQAGGLGFIGFSFLISVCWVSMCGG